MTAAQRGDIVSPADGLMVHDVDTHEIWIYDGGTTSWQMLVQVSSLADADADTKVEVERTADEDLVKFQVEGKDILTLDTFRIITQNNDDIYIGDVAGQGFPTFGSPSSRLNTVIGNSSFGVNTDGIANTSLGFSNLQANTTGSDNVAIGPYALHQQRTGSSNVAIGKWAMRFSDSGDKNVAISEQKILH